MTPTDPVQETTRVLADVPYDMLNRVLRGLADERLIHVERNRIVILDRAGLELGVRCSTRPARQKHRLPA